MADDTIYVLVIDSGSKKASRFAEKIGTLLQGRGTLIVSIVGGYGGGSSRPASLENSPRTIEGSILDLAASLREQVGEHPERLRIAALNQTAVLPALALRRQLGLPARSGIAEACDKGLTRRLLANTDFGLPFAEAAPGETLGKSALFGADRYVVKPALGMSSRNVKFFDSWPAVRSFIRNTGKLHSEASRGSLNWLPGHVIDALGMSAERNDMWIVEPYVDGTEFTVDGWIKGESFSAIVQHKLKMIEASTFVGDGPIITPPCGPEELPAKWSALRTDERTICKFAEQILGCIGFTEGVFHIEGRERLSDGQLVLLEVNPRAPGGSLWHSAALRTGEDLEAVDAAFQFGLERPAPTAPLARYALHQAFHAEKPGKLVDWRGLRSPGIDSLRIDYAVPLGTTLAPSDFDEEPILADVTAYDETLAGILEKCEYISRLEAPLVEPVGKATSAPV